MKENKDIYTIGRFNWKSGSINSNIIAMAKEMLLDYRYNHFFQLELGIGTDFRKVGYKHIQGDEYEVYLEM